METEHSDPYNNKVGKISNDLYSLRQIEHSGLSMKAKYQKASPLIRYLTTELLDQENFVLYRPMWGELHDRSVYYYNYLNKLNLDKKIPLFRATLHNDMVKWWLKSNRLSGTLVHFDSHDDMILPASGKYLLKGGKIDKQNISKGACGKICYPVSCILLSKKIDHVIWGIPQWMYDDNARFDQALVYEKSKDLFTYLRLSGQKKDQYLIEDDVEIVNEIRPEKYDFYHPFILERLRIYTLNAWKQLGKSIQGNEFILDIDLDFFVTNGTKQSKHVYKTEFDDLESTGRVHGFPGVVTPRAAHEDDTSEKVAKNLNKELGLVYKRVTLFLSGLEILKNMGITPCCISIADSTPSYFSGNVDSAIFTNHYTPKYFVPILNSWLIDGLHKLYGKSTFY